MAEKKIDLGGDEALLKPILETGKGFYLTVITLIAITLCGFFLYSLQYIYGLGVTGMNHPITWGFYVTNFVFFIGISHAGTLISAILRISQAEWRRPITRVAEVITVMVLGIGGLNILVDLGRPDRFMNVIYHGRYQSPLLWDATSITAYLTASTLYLYLPLIPDIAILRDRVKKFKWFYQVLAMGWMGTPKQEKVLSRAIGIMAIVVLPVAISVHTVVSFVFSMTLQPMWHSTIFGPYFVCGAIFSGLAALIIAMTLVRRILHLERYLKQIHFSNLGILMLVMSLLWFYFTFAEYITIYYGQEPEEMKVFWSKFNGPYEVFFWGMVLFNFLIPVFILSFRRTRTIAGTTVASAFIVIGMWVERFLIVVPTLANPRLPYGPEVYIPTLVEIGETIMCFSLFILFFVLFTKVFPIISIWEVQEGRTSGVKEVSERIRSYLPDKEAG